MTEVDCIVDWYKVGYNSDILYQGEILLNCSIIEPKVSPEDIVNERNELDVNEIKGNFVILSQSCDLEQDNIDLVVVSSVYSIGNFVAQELTLYEKAKQCAKSKQQSLDQEKDYENMALECNSIYSQIKKIRKGELPAYHLLEKEDSIDFPYSLVNFHQIYSIPKKFLLEFVKNQQDYRICLIPPYREHLSQAFARYFMRVGLPSEVSAFT